MKRTHYAAPANGTAATVVSATQPSRRVTIREDGPNPQGLTLFYADDNFTHGYNVPAGMEITLGNTVAAGKGAGPWVGLPQQKDMGGTVVLCAATVLFKVTSATATATDIQVVEFD